MGLQRILLAMDEKESREFYIERISDCLSYFIESNDRRIGATIPIEYLGRRTMRIKAIF